ncbi:MAG: biotin--[acetyl-CoA-carboxylase] ligase [Thermodesulfobacteriota bacterium]
MESFGHIIVVGECGSTQDLALERARSGEPEGTAVLCLNQTGGRGSQGREWVSPTGKNVAMSVLLRPSLPSGEAPLLGMMTSIAVARTVEKTGVVAQVRWPNDVLVEEKKIAGILPEARIAGGRIEVAIMGVGLNVNCRPEDFPPHLRPEVTSLLMCTGREWAVLDVARGLLDEFGELYQRVRHEGCAFVPRLWERWWRHRGRVFSRDGVTGTAEGIDADGALMLRNSDGRVLRITSGTALPVHSHE